MPVMMPEWAGLPGCWLSGTGLLKAKYRQDQSIEGLSEPNSVSGLAGYC